MSTIGLSSNQALTAKKVKNQRLKRKTATHFATNNPFFNEEFQFVLGKIWSNITDYRLYISVVSKETHHSMDHSGFLGCLSFSMEELFAKRGPWPETFWLLPQSSGFLEHQAVGKGVLARPNSLAQSLTAMAPANDTLIVSGRSRANMMINGLYTTVDSESYDQRPIYKQRDNGLYMYYHSGRGAWAIADAVGSHAPTAYVPADAPTPDQTTSAWWVFSRERQFSSVSPAQPVAVRAEYVQDDVVRCRVATAADMTQETDGKDAPDFDAAISSLELVTKRQEVDFFTGRSADPSLRATARPMSNKAQNIVRWIQSQQSFVENLKAFEFCRQELFGVPSDHPIFISIAKLKSVNEHFVQQLLAAQERDPNYEQPVGMLLCDMVPILAKPFVNYCTALDIRIKQLKELYKPENLNRLNMAPEALRVAAGRLGAIDKLEAAMQSPLLQIQRYPYYCVATMKACTEDDVDQPSLLQAVEWFRKLALQCVAVAGHIVPPQKLPPVPDTPSTIYRDYFYHGRITRATTLTMFQDDGSTNGWFLVRKDKATSDGHFLSYGFNHRLVHLPLVQTSDGMFQVGKNQFIDLLTMVQHYEKRGQELRTKLVYPRLRLPSDFPEEEGSQWARATVEAEQAMADTVAKGSEWKTAQERVAKILPGSARDDLGLLLANAREGDTNPENNEEPLYVGKSLAAIKSMLGLGAEGIEGVVSDCGFMRYFCSDGVANPPLAERLYQLDVNAEGQIVLADFLATAEASALASANLKKGAKEELMALIKSAQVGLIKHSDLTPETKAELSRIVIMEPTKLKAVLKEAELLDYLDEDGDGNVSLVEMLGAMDADGDGKISLKEFIAATGAIAKRAANFRADGTAKFALADTSKLELLNIFNGVRQGQILPTKLSTGAHAELTKLLALKPTMIQDVLMRAKLLEYFDQNNDGEVSVTELMAAMDLDKDGHISVQEFLKAAGAAIEDSVVFETDHGYTLPPIAAQEITTLLVQSRDRKPLLPLSPFACEHLSMLLKLDPEQIQSILEDCNMLSYFDNDGDGDLTLAEMLVLMDKDGDGQISVAEFLTACGVAADAAKDYSEIVAKTPPTVPAGMFDELRAIFTSTDTGTVDKYLSKMEVTHRMDFKKMNELLHQHNLVQYFDTNGDGKVNAQEIFTKMDKDGDGRISIKEFFEQSRIIYAASMADAASPKIMTETNGSGVAPATFGSGVKRTSRIPIIEREALVEELSNLFENAEQGQFVLNADYFGTTKLTYRCSKEQISQSMKSAGLLHNFKQAKTNPGSPYDLDGILRGLATDESGNVQLGEFVDACSQHVEAHLKATTLPDQRENSLTEAPVAVVGPITAEPVIAIVTKLADVMQIPHPKGGDDYF
jgi:Ca2+-binding EF-hand superfamily protein